MPSPPPSSSNFEEFILQGIKNGSLAAGSRLPSTAELAAHHQLDLRTVQKALSTLAAKGYLERKPRRGTFVCETPQPRNIVFLTGWNVEQEPSYMLRSLIHSLRETLAERGYNLALQHNLHDLLTGGEAHFRRECAQLKATLETLRPIGFIEYQFSLKRLSSIYPDFALPVVELAPSGQGGDIEYDREHFIKSALSALQAQGAKRVLLIRKGALNDPFNGLDAAFWRHLRTHRFKSGEIRELLAAGPPEGLEHAVESLFLELAEVWRHLPAKHVPDSLIVQDDIMMRGVATGLLKAEASRLLPHPLRIVHIANEGIHHHYGISTTRYELPIRRLAEEIAALLDRRLRRECPQSSEKPVRLPGRLCAAQTIPTPAPPHFGSPAPL